MAKKINWKENDLVSIKLRNDLFTIAQMLISPVMRFYGISNTNGVWEHINLNEHSILFEVFIGNIINKNIIENKITNESIIKNKISYGRF